MLVCVEKKRKVYSTNSASLAVTVEKEILMVAVVSSSDFQNKVINQPGLVLIDFFATWCGPCKKIGPVIEEISKEVEGKAKVYKVDIDQSPDIASRYGVMSVPTLVVFENGKVKQQSIGAHPKERILEMLSKG